MPPLRPNLIEKIRNFAHAKPFALIGGSLLPAILLWWPFGWIGFAVPLILAGVAVFGSGFQRSGEGGRGNGTLDLLKFLPINLEKLVQVRDRRADDAASDAVTTDTAVPPSALETLARFLANQPQVLEVAGETVRGNRDKQYERIGLNWILPSFLVRGRGDEEDYAGRLAGQIHRQLTFSLTAEEKAQPPAAQMPADQVKERCDADIVVHVCFLPDLPANEGRLLIKRLPTLAAHYTVVLCDLANTAGDGGRFLQWDDESEGSIARSFATTSEAVPFTAESVVHFGPREIESRALDLLIPGEAGSWRMTRLAHHEAQMRDLGVGCVKLTEPLPGAQIYTGDKKGTIRAVALFADGKLLVFQKTEHRTPLYRRRVNMLMRDPRGIDVLRRSGDSRLLLNPLLTDFLFNTKHPFHSTLQKIVSANGNFRLDYLSDQANGSKRGQFMIEPQAGLFTALLRRSIGMNADAWQNPDNYEELEPGRHHELPSPATILTRGADEGSWLVLELNLGSPAQVTAQVGGYRVNTNADDAALERALRGYARKLSYRDFAISEHFAQGFIGVGEARTGGRHFLKLLDPAHVREQDTEDICRRLIGAGLVPPEVQLDRVDPGTGAVLKGPDRETNGWLIIASPEYQTAADALAPGRAWALPGRRLLLCRAMAEFAEALWSQGVACPDWSLAETAFFPTAEPARVFVVDFGSYMLQRRLDTERSNRKLLYRAPEDFADRSIPFEKERNQVFVLGMLFLQALLAEPNAEPSFIGSKSEAEWNKAMREEVARTLDDAGFEAGEGLSDLVAGMLAWHPSRRFTLSQVVAALRDSA